MSKKRESEALFIQSPHLQWRWQWLLYNKPRHIFIAAQVFHDLTPYPDSACTFIQTDVAEESQEIFRHRGSLDCRSSFHPGPWQHKRRCHHGPGPERFIVPAHGTTKEVNKHQQTWLPSAVSPITHKPIPLKKSIYRWPQRLVPEVGESLWVSVCVCLYLNSSHTLQRFLLSQQLSFLFSGWVSHPADKDLPCVQTP